MEAHNSLQIIQSFVNTPTMEVSPPKTIKMEDITSTTSSQSLLDVPSADSKGSKDSKATKKRKSWGQVLPEPKTNLPPRKRAKTADEKEQRRIERVKRNRLAAHNSRERKRAEVEALQERNNQLEQHMKLMEGIIAQYQSKYPDSKIASVPHFEYEFDSAPAQLPPTPTSVSQFITEMPQRPQAPFEMHTPAPFSSPDSLLSTIDSPADTAPSTPGTSSMDGKADRTQQSAALLCDLQCQSASSPLSTLAATKITESFLQTLTSIAVFNCQRLLMMATSTSTLPSTQKTPIASSPIASTAR